MVCKVFGDGTIAVNDARLRIELRLLLGCKPKSLLAISEGDEVRIYD